MENTLSRGGDDSEPKWLLLKTAQGKLLKLELREVSFPNHLFLGHWWPKLCSIFIGLPQSELCWLKHIWLSAASLYGCNENLTVIQEATSAFLIPLCPTCIYSVFILYLFCTSTLSKGKKQASGLNKIRIWITTEWS